MNTASVAGLSARVAVGWMLAAATHLAAATCTWTGLGSDSNWSTGQNWSTSPSAPATGDDLVFSGSTRLTPNNDFGGGTSFKSVSIAVGAGAFVIGGNAIVLSGGATAVASGLTSGSATINLPLTFATSPPTITSAAGATLTLGGDIANGGLLVSVAAGGPITLGGAISGGGGVSKSAAGTLTMSGANTYAGPTTIAAGTLRLSGSGTLGGTAGVTTAALALTGAVLDLNNVAADLGVGTITTSTATASSITNIASGHTFTASGTVIFNGGGSNLVSGAGSFVVASAAGAFNVGTSVATSLDMSGLAAFSATVSTFTVGNSTAAVSSSLTMATSNTVIADSIGIGASSSNVAASGALLLGTTNILRVDTVTVGQKRCTGSIAFRGGLTAPTVTLIGKAGGAATSGVNIGDYNTNPGAYNPVGTIDLTGGTATVQIGTLSCGQLNPNGGVTSTMTATGALTIDGAASSVAIATARIGYCARDQAESASATGKGTLTIIAGAVTVGTLTIGDKGSFGSAGDSFNKVNGTVAVQGGSLTVNTLFRLGDQTVFGTAASQSTALLNITGGTVTCNVPITTSTTASAPAKTSLTLAGGTLDMTGHAIGATGATIGTGGGAITWGSGTLTAVAAINGSAGLAKSGASALTIAGACTYTGATTVSAGTLLVNGSTAAGSAVTVAGSAVLGGSGTTAGTVGVSASGTLAPGGAGVSIGTLSTGAVTFNAAATYSVDLDGGGPTADRVASSGTVTCAGTLSVASLANAAVGRIYTIISAGTVTGTFAGLADGATFTVGGRTLSIAYGATTVTLNDTIVPVLIARQTLDTDGNGRIDRIRLTFDQPVNDDFSGLTITVAGYATGAISTGAEAKDAIIEVPLTELAGPDTGATPAVRITVNTTLGFASGPWLVQAEGSGTTASDAAAPVLLATGWVDGGSAGVGAGDTVTLTFSESVQAVGATVADIGLPVTADTLSSTLVSDQQGASITMTLAGSPCLTPGGTYSVAALGAGKPSGIYLVSGTHLRDAAGNAAATGTPAAAIDLPPTTTTVALAWATASDPQTWNMGALTVGGAISSVGSGIDLTITNPGDSTVDVAIACSSTVPGGWSAGSAAAGDTYFMKADATGAAASQPGNPASYGLVMSGSGQNIVSGLTSGRSSFMALYFQAPTSLSPGGGGTAQAIVVAVTATLAP